MHTQSSVLQKSETEHDNKTTWINVNWTEKLREKNKQDNRKLEGDEQD